MPALIATSIAPNNRVDVQQKAISSWISSGFDVVSLNAEEEISLLKEHFDGVSFAPQLRTAKHLVGRPYIFISDFLQYFRLSNKDHFGIVNSDIYMSGDEGLLSWLNDQSVETATIMPRLEVNAFEDTEGEFDPLGFDAFFFSRPLLSVWPESSFCLGLAHWDHWFPLMPLLAGNTVNILRHRGIRHIPHPVSRDESYFMFTDHFTQLILAEMKNAASGFGKDFDSDRYDVLMQAREESKDKIKGGEPQNESEFLTQLADFYDDLSKYVVAYIYRNGNKVSLP